MATGHGSETARDFKDYIEKAETKAIGRALAALGFGTQFAPDIDDGSSIGRVVDAPVSRPRAETTRTTPNGNGHRDLQGPARVPNEPDCSEAQIKRLRVIGSQHNPPMDHDALKHQAFNRYGVLHLEQMSVRQASHLMACIEADDLVDGPMPPSDGDPVERAEKIPDPMRR
jgi:hypothetical protein